MKHLIYYIYPLRAHMVVYNLKLLKKHYHLFDGKKICYLSYDKHSIPVDLARNLIKKNLSGIEIVIVRNDEQLGEAKHFLNMIERTVNLPGFTFYAHAKGVWRRLADMPPLMMWIKKLYDYNLIYDPEKHTQKIGVAGAFRRHGKMKPLSAEWHFSGSFFWINNEMLSKRNWRVISPTRHGTEEYPAMHFSKRESYCIAHDHAGNLYKRKTWQNMNIKLES